MDTVQAGLIEAYLRAVLEANKRINLTSITSYEDAVVLHLEDSLSALPELKAAPEGPFADLGSGGGFPGVPLALASGRETVLVESVKKKSRAVQGLVERLGLVGIRCYSGRSEELACEQPEGFVAVTARALAPLPVLLELASPLLAHGGVLVAYKSASCSEEQDRALLVQDSLGMEFVSRRGYSLSGGRGERAILAFRKCGTPAISLPRRVGLAQKKPFA